jgi:IclR family acetate operon transcriptional repressor
MNLIFKCELLLCNRKINSSAMPTPAPLSAAADAPPSPKYVIPNLRNACQVLKLLGRQSEGLKTIEVSRALKIPITSALRILNTLQLESLVRKANGRYELGPALIQLGHLSLHRTEIRATALPILEKLSLTTTETSHLAILCDDRALIVAVQDSPHPLRAASRPGFLADLHCSSTGKVFLAYHHGGTLPPAVLGEKRERRTPHTQVTPEAIRREARLTRARGYGLDNEEYFLGVRCLAAPVFGSNATVVAAIGITAAAVRFTEASIPAMAEKVKAAAAELSRLLGYSGTGGS